MTTEHGYLQSVNAETQGDELLVAASAGAGALVIGDSCDFDEDGGWLRINGEVHAYTAVDTETETITLADTLTASAAVETRVDVWDADNGTPVVEYVASVILDGQTEGDPIQASIDHALVPLLTQGIRTEGGESVTLDWVGDDLRVVAVAGKTPFITGTPFRTSDSATDRRIEIDDVSHAVNMYSGAAAEITPGYLTSDVIGGDPSLTLSSPRVSTGSTPYGYLRMFYDPAVSSFSGETGGLLKFDMNVGGAAGHGLLIGIGSRIRGFDFGYFTGTTNASGDVSISHALGAIPDVVLLHTPNSARPNLAWNAKAANTASVISARFANTTTNAALGAGSAVEVFWLALR